MSGIIGGAGSKSGVIGFTEPPFEEGTWEPTGTGVSDSNGFYQKIGKKVFCSCFVSIDVPSGPDNNEITGLPFTVAQTSGSKGSGIQAYVSGTSETIACNPTNGQTNFRMYFGTNRFTIPHGNNFYGSFTYFID